MLHNECLEQVNHVLMKRVNTVAMVVYSLVFVLGTIGNGLVIFITGFRMKKTVHAVWILNLAIADFTFSIFLPFNIVYVGLNFHWPFGRIMCKLIQNIAFFNLIASIFLLVVISVDRCITVWWPVWTQNCRTPRLASFVALGVWILAVLFFSPDLYFTETYYDDETNTTYCLNTYDINEGGESIHHVMVIARFIFGFAIPFSVIVICYGAVAWRIRRDHLSPSSRPFKIITAVIVAFFVCWFPFHIFSFLIVKALNECSLHVVAYIGLLLSYSLAHFNSCLNPVLYFCLGHNFKDKMRCSLLSALVNAFTEESNQSTTKTKTRSSAELESHSL
ncbi:chemerin-like receptor 1 [Tiliqua scincoides]|uniref:chemerin-like receptor 1 n=1 Tax=Tiliqua scincoides TaxID=71010 RepID=UPI0034626F48